MNILDDFRVKKQNCDEKEQSSCKCVDDSPNDDQMVLRVNCIL